MCVCLFISCLLLRYYTSQPPLPPVTISLNEVGGNERSVSTLNVLQGVREKTVAMNTTGTIWAEDAGHLVISVIYLFITECKGLFCAYSQSH